ncbi:MAG: hypothetical protein ACRDAI_08230 [Candidatus Rhabdochlamydia sp.]
MLKLTVLFFSIAVYCRMEDYLKKVLDKSEVQQLRNIDFIHMINLDERPEKHEHSVQQLTPYGIVSYPFSAVNDCDLPFETINSIRVSYSRMKKILNFIRNNPLFVPIDMEYILPDQIHLFTVINDVVSTLPRAFTNNAASAYL